MGLSDKLKLKERSRGFLSFALIFLFAGIYVSESTAKSAKVYGLWAVGGVALDEKQKQAQSPDGKLTVRFAQNGYELVLAGKKILRIPDTFSTPGVTEVAWSGNSRMFAVNGSDGGAVGDWHTVIYTLDDQDRPKAKHMVYVLAPYLRNFAHCEKLDHPGVADGINLGTAGWLNDDRELLIIAQVTPDTSCKNLSALKGFRVRVADWAVVEQIPERSLRRQWKKYLLFE